MYSRSKSLLIISNRRRGLWQFEPSTLNLSLKKSLPNSKLEPKMEGRPPPRHPSRSGTRPPPPRHPSSGIRPRQLSALGSSGHQPSFVNPSVNVHSLRQMSPQTKQAFADVRNLCMKYKSFDSDDQFHNILNKHWSSSNLDVSPYQSAMSMALNFPDFEYGKSYTYSAKVLKAFHKWILVEENKAKHESSISQSLQNAVFDSFVDQKILALTTLAFHCCDLHVNNVSFKPKVETLLKAHQYGKACQVISALDLHQDYGVQDLVIPLLLENKIDTAKNFLLKAKNLQKEVLEFLDGLVEDNFVKVCDLRRDYRGNDLSTARLEGKALGRFIDSWVKLFNLPASVTPNRVKQKNRGSFKYQVGMKDDKNMRRENWREIIQEHLNVDPLLRLDLLNFLIEGHVTSVDFSEAVYWVKILEMSDEEIPPALSMEMNPNTANNEVKIDNWDLDTDEITLPPQNQMSITKAIENWNLNAETAANPSSPSPVETEPEYFQLPEILATSIKLVETVENFEAFTEHLANVAAGAWSGLDAEFSSFGANQNSLSTVQIAFWDQIFILDMIKLKTVLVLEHWIQFMELYFLNKSIFIAGYAIQSDFQVLSKSLAVFSNLEEKAESVLDLELLGKRLTCASKCYLIKPFSSDLNGLSGLVESLFGLPLDKRDQISNWNKRPLTENQVKYAALDAYVLLEVFERLKDLAQKENKQAKFEVILKQLFENKNRLVKSKRNKLSKKQKALEDQMMRELDEKGLEPPEHYVAFDSNNRVPSELKVVCDSMLQGLCKKLRLHGVDAIAVEDFEDVNDILLISSRDKRHIVTKSPRNYVRMKARVTQCGCFFSTSDKLEEQVEEIFRFFNVHQSKEDFFSRCTLCNNSNYITIPSDDLKTIKADVQSKFGEKSSEVTTKRTFIPPDDDSSEDSYGGYGFDDDEDDDWEPGATSLPTINWRKFEGGEVNTLTGTTRSGTILKVEDIPDEVFEKQNEFYCCSTCGKIYWQGSHWKKVTE